MIPLLLRPKLLSIRNALGAKQRSTHQTVRVLVLLIFAAVLSYSIFYGTRTLAIRLIEASSIAYISPSVPFGLLFLFIGIMVLLSSGVTAVGALFHARDLDLILASPISPPRFISTKILEVVFSSSWIVIIFGVPAMLGFGMAYNAGIPFYLSLLAVVPAFILIPNLIGVIFGTIFASILPASRTRELLGILACLSFVALFALIELIIPDSNSWQDLDSIVRMISILLIPHKTWMPSFWAASAISETIEPTRLGVMLPLILLYSAAITLVFLSYALLRTVHFSAYSKARANKLGSKIVSGGDYIFIKVLPLSSDIKAIIEKEFRTFTRDITQALQLLLLLGLCVLYLYNLRVLNAVQGLAGDLKIWWEGFLTISNIALGAFLISAMCTRFAFPSVSLEGQSWWILNSSPLGARRILRGKSFAWLLPVFAVAITVFAAGSLAIGSSTSVILYSIGLGLMIAYGIVGLAIGLGAQFANFEWEHSSQLAASFGSLVFMLTSMIAIIINIAPIALLAFLRNQYLAGYLDQSNWHAALICTTSIIAYMNCLIHNRALAIGENALLQRNS